MRGLYRSEIALTQFPSQRIEGSHAKSCEIKSGAILALSLTSLAFWLTKSSGLSDNEVISRVILSITSPFSLRSRKTITGFFGFLQAGPSALQEVSRNENVLWMRDFLSPWLWAPRLKERRTIDNFRFSRWKTKNSSSIDTGITRPKSNIRPSGIKTQLRLLQHPLFAVYWANRNWRK